MGFWLPWWPILALHSIQEWKKWTSGDWRQRLKTLPWEPVAALFVLLIFSFVSSKLVTYTLPGLPLLAVGFGAILSNARMTFLNRYGWFSVFQVATMVLILIGLNLVHNSLGLNSSTKQAIKILNAKGADLIICDRFLPGLEFYTGAGVWYVDTKDLVQVEGLRAQNPDAHFTTSQQVHKRLRDLDKSSVWLMQSGGDNKPWEQQLIDERPHPEQPAISVGVFHLWQVK